MLEHSEYLKHRKWMNHALELARVAGNAGEVPVGAVIVDTDDHLVAVGENRKERDQDPTAHAEIMVIRAASQILQSWRLHQCTLYVTLEPCPMCAGAIVHGRLGKLIYGVDDTKTGAIRTVINIPDHPVSNHHLKVLGGILESECRELLQGWFASQRQYKR